MQRILFADVVPIQELETWLFDANEPIDLHHMFFNRKTVDVFFCIVFCILSEIWLVPILRVL